MSFAFDDVDLGVHSSTFTSLSKLITPCGHRGNIAFNGEMCNSALFTPRAESVRRFIGLGLGRRMCSLDILSMAWA